MKINKRKTQWEKRVLCFRIIYSFLMVEEFEDQLFNKTKEILSLEDEYIKQILITFLIEKNHILKLIELNSVKKIKTINFVEVAIIMEATCEFITHKIQKSIIIDQAITTCKRYAGKDAYKFVNFILNKILE